MKRPRIQLAISLRALTLILTTAFAAVTLVIAYGSARVITRNRVKEANVSRAAERLNYLHFASESYLRLGQENRLILLRSALQELMSSFAGSPDLNVVMVTAPDGTIIASSHPEEAGRTWESTNYGINAKIAEGVIRNRLARVIVDEDRSVVEGYTFMCDRTAVSHPEPGTCGFLFYQLNLAYHMEAAGSDLVAQTVITGAGLLGGSGVLWWMLTYLITRRAERIGRGLRSFAEGQRNHRIDLGGQDEIARLAQSVDRLFDRVESDEAKIHDREERLIHINEQLKKANGLLAEAAVTDSLTGLFNRRYFDARIEEEIRRAQRQGLAVSLIMCDVDHFKPYNDHYGHQAGDQCLQKVASEIHTCFRRGGEFSARYGGEEFVIILPGLDLDQAWTRAEDLRTIVEKKRIPHDASPTAPYVTLSLGVACHHPNDAGEPQISAIKLLRRADETLYRAKESGRNRTEREVASN
ncbi:MAG TPA: diguanylate cyclase [Leptospiraceae bacterium]|nr:diguanylate cyclase [Leptospiraceae bacterium]HNL00815.1 diguanylate cyclase [Leptospiraceae bacterium]